MADISDLTTRQFLAISQIVKERCGINLHDGKVALVKARLNKRLRRLGLDSFGGYVDYLSQDSGEELVEMLDAVSTNLTYFFREPHHFEFLTTQAVPELIRRRPRDRRLRAWSAGCSSGEEAYSISMTLRQAIADIDRWDVGILATDLSRRMLEQARQGVYPVGRLRHLPRWASSQCFEPAGGQPGFVRVSEPVRRLVNFARLNLMDPWPMKGLFDVIFCRNVMIYFDRETQGRLVQRFWSQLAPGGWLFVGHSESLAGVRHKFGYVRPTIYQKPAKASAVEDAT